MAMRGNESSDIMDEFQAIDAEYLEMFGEDFPSLMYSESLSLCIRKMKECINNGEPYKPIEVDGDVLLVY